MKLTELIAHAQTALDKHGDLDVGIPDDGCGLCRPDDAESFFGDCANTAVGMTTGYTPELRFLLSLAGPQGHGGDAR